MSEVLTAHSDIEHTGAEQGEAAALIVGRRSIVLPNSWTWLQWRVVSAAVVLTACIGIALRSVVYGGGGEAEVASDHEEVRLPGVQEEVLVSSPQITHIDDDGRPCHTAVRGEECYGKVMWALEVGMRDHPEWYHKKMLTTNASFLEVQSALHELSAASDCPRPCTGLADDAPTPKTPTLQRQINSSHISSGSGGRLSCNPSACEWGLTCKNAAAICCAEDDWECCAEGGERYKNRMYCPLKGHYKVMCWNGECADSEEVCATEARGGVKFGAKGCQLQARRMRYVGCYMDDVSNGELQSNPLWCSSVEECKCKPEYPFVAFLNGNTLHHANMAQWSCLSKLPAANFYNCTSYGAWEVGAPGTYMSVYWNPLFKSERLDVQPIDMTQTNAGGGEPLPVCHTAVRGEDCFNFILWSISIGIHDHPTWYNGKITSQSSFEDIQAAVASQKTSKCGEPCPVDLMRRTRSQSPDTIADIARFAAWKSRLSAGSSSRAMCHSTVAGERCYNVVMWAMQTRIYKHPNWEGSGLMDNSSMQEVQDVLHMDEGAGCPRACPAGHSEGAGSLPSEGSSSRKGPPCNPTMCARGLTCQGNRSSCCEEGDWGCCGRGQERYKNRKYCPSRGGYTVLCNNGECADSLEECDDRGGIHYGAQLCPAPAHYVGCYVEGSGALGLLQTSPLWCSSMDECQCPPQFPYVGYSNGNTLHYPDRAQWSCYVEVPSQTWSGCASYGRWEVGAPGPYVSIYRNPKYDAAESSFENAAVDQLAPAVSTPWPCHTAIRGDTCFSAVLSVLATGINANPDTRKMNLTENSTFEEVQLALSLNGTAGCPLPCIIASPSHVNTSTSAANGMLRGLDADREAKEMDQLRNNVLITNDSG